MRRSCFLIGLLIVSCSFVWGAKGFSTLKLKAMASSLSLPGLDTLSTGEYSHFSYKTRPLFVRINRWNEVEHIGLKLFESSVKNGRPLSVYDFMERYLLELDLNKGTEQAIRLGLNRVSFLVGNSDTVFDFDGTEEFECSLEAFRTCQATWKKGGENVLTIAFDLDYQMLSGCDIVELEQNYLKKLKHYEALLPNDFQEFDFPKKGKYHVVQGATFMLDVIRNDLYFKKGETWSLLSDTLKPVQSISNTMISRNVAGDYGLSVTFDLYGYNVEQMTKKLDEWLGLCEEEGCIAYFGLKEKLADAYTGTVFMVNENLGYMHMLSVKFPMDTLRKKKGNIEGRMFVYVPLHNVSERFFNQTDYIRFSDEKE